MADFSTVFPFNSRFRARSPCAAPVGKAPSSRTRANLLSWNRAPYADIRATVEEEKKWIGQRGVAPSDGRHTNLIDYSRMSETRSGALLSKRPFLSPRLS